jgi:hypothetical protein
MGNKGKFYTDVGFFLSEFDGNFLWEILMTISKEKIPNQNFPY